ncbi:MAG: HAD family hydrolase [Ktedonobacterales bacterium]|nr:HAD family hydrolase [Ktedonobacterales bacterium]
MAAAQPERGVFLLDCDNTLLDNDALKADLARRLRALLGDTLAARFWQRYEEVRREADGVDLPLTFAAFRADCPDEALLAHVRATVMDYPFAERLYPETLATLAYLTSIGTPVILSDGDASYQPRKIEGSGLAAAVAGRVAIYLHKEDHLTEVMARWPAPFYVMVDDKPRILATLKARYPDRFVTVQIVQGHYAHAGETFAPPPDVALPGIGDLRGFSSERLRGFLRV